MAFVNIPGSIESGWTPFAVHAAPIGELVHSILQNRLGEQQLQQQSISDAVKQIQAQRSDQAFVQAAQQAGVLPQGDYGALGAKGGAALAQLIQAQTPDTDLDAYHKAAAAREQAIADAIRGGTYPGRGGGGGNMVTLTDDNGDPILDNNGNPIRVPSGSKLGQQFLVNQNPNLTAPMTPSTAAGVAAKMSLTPQSITDTSRHMGMGYAPGSVDQFGNTTDYLPVSPDQPATDIKVTPSGTNPATGQPYAPVIVQRDTLERLRRGLQGPSYMPGPDVMPTYPSTNVQPQDIRARTGAAPSATPSPTPPGAPGQESLPTGGAQAQPSATPRVPPNASTGAPVNPATGMSADDVRSAYQSGKMSFQEAHARLKALGFSD